MQYVSKEISWKTFFQHVNKSDVKEMFDYDITKDYAVSAYKSIYKGKPCFYIQHSRIEYVFTK
jgi:hypothetical protein